MIPPVYQATSTFVQPSGMWLSSLVSGNELGHVNVPDAATLYNQLPVAPLVHSVNATSTELNCVHPENMLS